MVRVVGKVTAGALGSKNICAAPPPSERPATPGIWHPVFWHPVSGIWYLVSGIWYPVSGILNHSGAPRHFLP
jgi:hypothetical protein